jgi:hypothetical protein
MFQLSSSLNFLLIGNSFITILLIFNQNESKKDAITNRNVTSSSNPLEKITWVCLCIQLLLLLLKTKMMDF